MSVVEDTSFRGALIRNTPGVNSRRLAFLLCCLLGLAMATPLAWLVRSSLMEMGQIFVFPPQWIPNPLALHNYPDALTTVPFQTYFFNSLLIVVPTIVGTLISCSMAGYAFSRLSWPFRDQVFAVLMATLMLPYVITLIPTFLIWSKLGAVDSYTPLVLPNWLGSNAFFIFLLRQFFKNLPRELDEAATIDGAHIVQVFWYIILPLSRPALLVVAILSGLNAWNDFIDPLVYINSADKYTVALGLSQFVGLYTSQWSLLMAASVVVILPVVIVFFFTQRYFMASITMTGLKG
jgi:multiple sugar transport system permease protein